MLKGLRVLIVEDVFLVAEGIKHIVEVAGAVVLGPIPTLEGALDYVAADEDIGVALVDMNLRDQFADELNRRLVENGIPFIIVTGYEALPMDDSDAFGVVHKPVDKDELLAMLCRVVAGK